MVRLAAAQHRSGSPADRARAAGLGGSAPGGARNLSGLSTLLRQHENLNGAREQVRRMQGLVAQADKATTEEDRAQIAKQLSEADARYREFESARSQTPRLPAFSVADASATAGDPLVLRLRQTEKNIADTTGSVFLDATLSPNVVTSVDVSKVTAGDDFLFSQNGQRITLTNTRTSAEQEIDVGSVAGINGAKLLDFDQLDVKLTLTGAASLNGTLFAKTLEGQTINTSLSLSDATVVAEDLASGAVQGHTSQTLTGSTGRSRVSLEQIGFAITIAGTAIPSGDLSLRMELEPMAGVGDRTQQALRLTDVVSGKSESVHVEDAAFGGDLRFDDLGVVLEIDADAPGGLAGVLAALQGAPAADSDAAPVGDGAGVVDLFGDTGDPEARRGADLATDLESALLALDRESGAIRGDIAAAARALGRTANGLEMINSERNAAAVLRQLAEAAPSLLTLSHRDPGAPTALRLLGSDGFRRSRS
ncbi:MAG: hypothetical protein DK306_000458 [Chloroflexi bacterium]|nr:MAG: hypothetical protein DK306_000458 [Chloroflexota bacterium]